MKIIFCGGGTVGHITPAIAVADYINKHDKTSEILFIGRDGGTENKIIELKKYKMLTIDVIGFKRNLSLKNIKCINMTHKASKRVKHIIDDFKPDIVYGTGGYVTFPVIRHAQKMKIKTVIHESNACPGFATKLLAPKCDRLLLNLPDSDKYFKRKENIRIVGNPVRSEFFSQSKEYSRKKLGIRNDEILISSFGGSGGSEIINNVILAVMRSFTKEAPKIKHFHSCGQKYYKTITEHNSDLLKNKGKIIITPYVDDSPTLMIASDIIISRCGAVTLSEISACGKPAILIPSPNVTNDHQRKNAKIFSDAEAATVIDEAELNERTLLDAIKKLVYNDELRKSQGQLIKKYSVKDSANVIYNELVKLL